MDAIALKQIMWLTQDPHPQGNKYIKKQLCKQVIERNVSIKLLVVDLV